MNTETPIRVDIVSDVVCPWCVIGYRQLAQAARDTETQLDVYWHPFELNPDMAPEGENLRDHIAAKYGTTPEDSVKARDRLTEMGKELGFTFNYADDMRMYNTFRAHQLIDWATEAGKGHEMKQELFAAFFTRREDVSNGDVLVRAAEAIGLSGDAARQMLNAGDRATLVREKQRFWLQQGIQGVPAMVFERQHLITGAQGVQNYTSILAHLQSQKAA